MQIPHPGQQLRDKRSGEVFDVTEANESVTRYRNAEGDGEVMTKHIGTEFDLVQPSGPAVEELFAAKRQNTTAVKKGATLGM